MLTLLVGMGRLLSAALDMVCGSANGWLRAEVMLHRVVCVVVLWERPVLRHVLRSCCYKHVVV
jgi:hypothetical protein